MGDAFEERKKELIDAGEWIGNKQLVRFAYGNTYQKVPNPKKAY